MQYENARLEPSWSTHDIETIDADTDVYVPMYPSPAKLERYAQIHGGTLDQYISNFDAVRETLSGHPVFAAYLDPLEPTRKRLEKHLAPKVALFDGSESHRASVATAPVSSSSPCDRWPRPYHCLASSRSGVGPRRRR